MRHDQAALTEAMKSVFSNRDIVSEWPSLSGERGHYSPRVDIAVGPFAVEGQYTVEYDRLGSKHRDLLTRLHQHFVANVRAFGTAAPVPDLDAMLCRNSNARCFIAIEIEGSGSRKHIMGGMINAAALGRLGVSLAASEANLRTLLRVRQYMLFLGERGKNSFDPKNSLLLTTHQFADAFGVTLNGG